MTVQVDNSTNGVVTLKAPVSGALTITLPTTDGTTGQALVTNGSGVLSFSTVGGGSGMSGTTIQAYSLGAL